MGCSAYAARVCERLGLQVSQLLRIALTLALTLARNPTPTPTPTRTPGGRIARPHGRDSRQVPRVGAQAPGDTRTRTRTRTRTLTLTRSRTLPGESTRWRAHTVTSTSGGRRRWCRRSSSTSSSARPRSSTRCAPRGRTANYPLTTYSLPTHYLGTRCAPRGSKASRAPTTRPRSPACKGVSAVVRSE